MGAAKFESHPRRVQMTLATCVAVNLIAIACASSQRQPAQGAAPPPEPAPAQDVQAPPAAADASDTPTPLPIPATLERLVRSVRALDDSAQNLEHQRVIRSLRDASDVLEAIERGRGEAAAPLRASAQRLEFSDQSSLDHVDELRRALIAAQERLRALDRAAERVPAFDAALVALGRDIDTLNASRPLLEQQPAVSSSFRALADALFLAAGHEAPFADRARESRSVEEVLEHTRADVLALGRADLSNIRELTSRAMYSMAELVEGLTSRGAASARVAAIRAEARRLEHDSSGPFARAGWVERGLDAALGALDELEVCREPVVASWVEAARRSARGLPQRGSLPFQHAAIQDAFRSTLDAIGLAIVDREACEAPTPGDGITGATPS
jgi:hypothetical protein